MTVTVEQLTTAEDLWAMPEVPGKQVELVNGEVREMPGAGALHAVIGELVLRLISVFVRERNLGLALADNAAYTLRRNPDLVRIPDASYVSWSRVPSDGVPVGYWPFGPDLAVEIVSPNDLAREVHGKVQEYLDAGTRMVWVLWPETRSLTLHEPGGIIRELGPDALLDGGDVLPGFQTRVGALFEIPSRP